MAYNKVFEFSAEVRGYHYYRFWIPQKIKSLNAFLKLITHLIALQSKYAKLEMKMLLPIFLEKYHALRNFSWIFLTSKHCRRSPLVQGGMEITCKVIVKIPGTCVNILLMKKYKQLVQQLYIEPKNE